MSAWGTAFKAQEGVGAGAVAVPGACFRLDGWDGCACIRPMKSKLLGLVSAVCFVAMTLGCYHTVDGGRKVGVPFAKDKLVSRYERTVDQVFTAAKDVLGFMGTLTGENTLANVVSAKVDARTVSVKVEAVEPGITQITVQARKKSGFSDIDLASEVDKRIALQLK